MKKALLKQYASMKKINETEKDEIFNPILKFKGQTSAD